MLPLAPAVVNARIPPATRQFQEESPWPESEAGSRTGGGKVFHPIGVKLQGVFKEDETFRFLRGQAAG